MIKKPATDIDGLFRSFGADNHGYRELAREADAREAQQRWPMLGDIEPEAALDLTKLDGAQKRNWRQHAQGSDGAVLPVPERGQESGRLASGLDGLLRRGVVTSQTPAAAAKDVTARTIRGAGSERPAREASRSLFAKGGVSPADKQSKESSAPRGGLFGRLGGKEEEVDDARDSHSLSGLFARIGGDNHRSAPSGRRRTGK